MACSIERADSGSPLLTLNDTQWTLLRLLWEARGKPLTVSQLVELTGKERTAVNPGLQRLREKLRKAGLESLVYNVDGSGYAIDMTCLEAA